MEEDTTEDTTEVMAMDTMVTTTALRNTFIFMFMVKTKTAAQAAQAAQAPVQATRHQPIRRLILLQATDTDTMATMVITDITATVITDMVITESLTLLSSTIKAATTDMQ